MAVHCILDDKVHTVEFFNVDVDSSAYKDMLVTKAWPFKRDMTRDNATVLVPSGWFRKFSHFCLHSLETLLMLAI